MGYNLSWGNSDMKHLSYEERANKELISNLLMINEEIVFVKLSPKDLTWKILAIDPDWRLVAEGKGIDLDALRGNARKRLVSLGAVFEDSIRG
jgi:hypothetical protein